VGSWIGHFGCGSAAHKRRQYNAWMSLSDRCCRNLLGFGHALIQRYNPATMVSVEETIATPLVVTDQGTIRIKGSRVSLDSIVHHFKLGATAEQIAQSFPSLSLGDVYSSIAYYLTHRPEIEEYLASQESMSDALQEKIESQPGYQTEIAELRSRIMGRLSDSNGGAKH